MLHENVPRARESEGASVPPEQNRICFVLEHSELLGYSRTRYVATCGDSRHRTQVSEVAQQHHPPEVKQMNTFRRDIGVVPARIACTTSKLPGKAAYTTD
jgi:hypothetical protein